MSFIGNREASFRIFQGYLVKQLNEAKQQKQHQQLADADSQTSLPEPQFEAESGHNTGVIFGVDFGVDACVQTDQQICMKCHENESLIDELVELLETIEGGVAYMQALECEGNFNQLVEHLDSIEKDMLTLTKKHRNEKKENKKEQKDNRSTTVYQSGTAYTLSCL